MGMDLVGVLPVSGVNVGLSLVPPVLQAEITRLGLDLSKLKLAIATKLEVGLNVPNFVQLEATLAMFPPTIAKMFSPESWLTLGADLNVELVAQLGLISVAVDLAASLLLKLGAGFSVGGIAAWCYSGPASGLADLAKGAMPDSWGAGLMVATESLSSWGQFSVSVNTGKSKDAVIGGPPNLTFLGELNGGEISTGLLELKGLLDLLHLSLTGAKVALSADLQLTAGINLPDPSELLALVQEVISDVEALFSNLIHADVDLAAEIGSIELQLEYVLSLTASIGAQLSAGGLALWTYSGGPLGSGVATAIADGVPGGGGPSNDIRAIVLAHRSPSVWAPFGALLGTA